MKIKNIEGDVIYSHDGENLRSADLSSADLNGANLSNAYLYGAYLNGADLSSADLSGAEGIIIFQKPNGRICIAVEHENGYMIQAGCFWGDLVQFEVACKKTYPNDTIKAYAPQIAMLKVLEGEYLKNR